MNKYIIVLLLLWSFSNCIGQGWERTLDAVLPGEQAHHIVPKGLEPPRDRYRWPSTLKSFTAMRMHRTHTRLATRRSPFRRGVPRTTQRSTT